MIRIGLLGCGNIGHVIAKNQENCQIVALYDQIFPKAQELAGISGGTAYSDFDSFVRAEFDYVVEAASVHAVRQYGEVALAKGKNLILLSVGALADPVFLSNLVETARKNERRVISQAVL